MKKQVRKLSLHRETLRSLDHPGWMRNVVGAATHASGCLTITKPCSEICGGTTGGSLDTGLACSVGCETGGACTVTCGACSDAC